MDQIKRLIASLTVKQRITIAAAALAMIGLLLSVSHWSKERDFKPLYTDLSPDDAGAVLAKVKESGSDYRIEENGSAILVPSDKVPELRLQLAAAGIPKTGRIGFELFDKTNFGATDFTEQVNYHRALEGELERSVMGLAEVEQARIHITFAKDSIFTEQREPAKASVLVKLRPGAKLTPQNVAAIRQLTASAVEGLLPDAVTVVDMYGNLLSRPKLPGSPDDPQPSDATIEYRQKLERDLVAKISATLAPILGDNGFRAGASVDCDFTSGEQSDETFDPTKSVMVSSQKTEDISSAAQTAGIPGAASNLPRPISRPGGGTGQTTTRRTENVAYESSHTVRRIRLPQGSVKRVSASVLVDYGVRWAGVGPNAKRIVEPPTPQKLQTIKDLVAAAIGFTPARGDQLVIEALPFESTLTSEPPDQPAPAAKPDPLDLLKKSPIAIGAGVAVALVLALGLFAIFRRKKKHGAIDIAPQLPETPAKGALPSPIAQLGNQIEAALAERDAAQNLQMEEFVAALRLPKVTTKKAEALTKHIAEQAKKDPAAMAHVLRGWLQEEGN